MHDLIDANCVFVVRMMTSFQQYTCYLNVMKASSFINHGLLLILAHLLLI